MAARKRDKARPRTAAQATAPDTPLAAADRRTAVARTLLAILARTIPDEHRLAIGLVDDPVPPDAASPARVRVHCADAVARLIFPPSADAFAEAYLRGDIEIDGDVGAAIEAGQTFDLRRADARRSGGVKPLHSTLAASSRAAPAASARCRTSIPVEPNWFTRTLAVTTKV